MDVWVVAAAAGAGYVAQKLKKLHKGKCNLCDLSSKQCSLDRTGSSCAALALQESLGQELCGQRQPACNNASTSEACNDFMFRDVVYNSNSLAGLLNDEDNNQGDWEDRVPSNSDGVVTVDSMPQSLPRDVVFCSGFGQNKSSTRGRGIRSKFMKPQTSLESCLMAQLYKEHNEFEEYICSLYPPPPKPSFRPLHAHRVPHESCGERSETVNHEVCNRTNPVEDDLVVGIPRLPDVMPTELWKSAKAKTGSQLVSLGSKGAKLVSRNQNNAQQGGLSGGALQFYIGLTVGIVYSFLGNTWEIEKLRKSLAQTQNLVQDLHEELEMKDALTVKELAVEDPESPAVPNDSCTDDAGQALSLEAKQDDSSRICNEQCKDQIADEESLRKIEAELEAELDMLETNMSLSRFKRQMSSLVKLDPNFVPDVIEGELRADLFQEKPSAEAHTDQEGSNRSTPRYAQYPISPRELTLRLHEVIETRLEERIRELEAALEHTQEKLRAFESHQPNSPRDIPKTPTPSNHESPVTRDGQPHSIDQPVIINLSRETPAAYNDDMYGDSPKLSDEEEMFHRYSQDRDSVETRGSKGQAGRGWLSRGSQEMVTNNSNNDGLFSSSRDDESEEEDDEMEKMLIKQLVEKARQGSPAAALLKAQRALLSTDL